jgi:tetratricopeptide (TPR) repeat protein
LQLLPRQFPWKDFPWARSINQFARGIGAARSGQLAAARTELEGIRKLQVEIPAALHPYLREEVLVQEQAVAAWLAFAQHREAEALRLAQAAADREDALDKHPVTPGEVLPARELFADMLLELGQNDAAMHEYRAVLEKTPNRFNALLGAAQAAERSGNSDAARQYFAAVLQLAGPRAAARRGLPQAVHLSAN